MQDEQTMELVMKTRAECLPMLAKHKASLERILRGELQDSDTNLLLGCVSFTLGELYLHEIDQKKEAA